MGEVKHTPGPWEARTFLVVGGKRFSDRICHVGSSTSLGPSRSDESVANARLIAAAPDLLEAIKALSASIFAPDDGRSPELSAALRMTVSAIAKAEGGAESLPLSTEGEEGR
jgi:hypothetical protein